MCLGVDAAGQPADDDEPRSCELPAQAAGNGGAVARARARADDGDGRLRQQLRLRPAAEEQPRRRVVDRRAAAAGSPAPTEAGSGIRRPRAARDTRARRSARWKARQRPPRGGRIRCVPVSDAKTASASSDTRQLVGRAIGERLRHVLGPHGIGLRERGDRPRDPSDARVAAPGEVEAVGGAAQERVRFPVARRRLRREPLPRGGDPVRPRQRSVSLGAAASSSPRTRGIARTRSKRSRSARESLSR